MKVFEFSFQTFTIFQNLFSHPFYNTSETWTAFAVIIMRAARLLNFIDHTVFQIMRSKNCNNDVQAILDR